MRAVRGVQARQSSQVRIGVFGDPRPKARSLWLTTVDEAVVGEHPGRGRRFGITT